MTSSLLSSFWTGSISVESHRSLQTPMRCVTGSFTLEFDGICNYESIKGEYAKIFNDPTQKRDGCSNTIDEDLNYLFGEGGAETWCRNVQEDQPMHSFQTPEFIRKFYAGGTEWNELRETLNFPSDGVTPKNVLKDDAVTVKNMYQASEWNKLSWPGDAPTSFEPLESCEYNAAMCCYVADRQAGDNNGNCASPYDQNCDASSDPGDNTELCLLDSEAELLSIFDNRREDGESAIHCHGFGWSTDDMHTTSRYKANNLFYVSMYDHMYKRGYVRPIPGSPMCGCLENMPVVTRSDCTQVDVMEAYKLRYDASSNTFGGSIIYVNVDYNSCQGITSNNNLMDYLRRLADDGEIPMDTVAYVNSHYLLDNGWSCYGTVLNRIKDQGFVWAFDGGAVDPSEWTYVSGTGNLSPEKVGMEGTQDPILFVDMLNASPNSIIRRTCPNCVSTHKDIYYKRLTPVPHNINLLDYLQNRFRMEDNMLGTDFKLYSSYKDALDDNNTWTYCNYDHVGFPRDCGPTRRVPDQWNRFYIDTNDYAVDVAFYVEGLSQDFASPHHNVAVGKLAYQTSHGWDAHPYKAIDGNFRQYYWPVHTISQTRDDDGGPYWEVYLMNTIVEVKSVTLFNRVDSNSQRLSDVTISLLDGPGGNELASLSHAGEVGYVGYFEFANPVGNVQAVRVKIAAKDYLALSEVYVDGTELGTPLKNVALNKPASMSSTAIHEVYTFDASNAVDGNTSGEWKFVAKTDWSTPEALWWKVDLQGTFSIYRILVFNISDSSKTKMKDLKVEILDDNEAVVGSMSVEEGTYPDPWVSMTFDDAVQGSAVRLTVNSNILCIAEVVVLSADNEVAAARSLTETLSSTLNVRSSVGASILAHESVSVVTAKSTSNAETVTKSIKNPVVSPSVRIPSIVTPPGVIASTAVEVKNLPTKPTVFPPGVLAPATN